MQWTVTETTNGFKIEYDLEWLTAIMAESALSMLPFTFFTQGILQTNRAYPRSNSPGFILHFQTREDTSPSAGGRQKIEGYVPVDTLCELFAAGCRALSVPLSDIAILSKRSVCRKVCKAFKGKCFTVMGGRPPEDEQKPDWPIYGYPMLCVIGRGSEGFPGNQGEWRVVQCVFGAVLTRLIREAKIGVEVVSREGFGSVFPTLADLPNGIRVDPGLLPPEEGAAAIVGALKFVDGFIAEMRTKTTRLRYIGDLDGYNSGSLNGVDRLMSVLLGYNQAKPDAKPGDYAKVVTQHDGRGSDFRPEPVQGVVEYVIKNVPTIVRNRTVKTRRKEREDSGYGSESDYEDDDSEKLEKFEKKQDESQFTEEIRVRKEKDKSGEFEKFKIHHSLDEEAISELGGLAVKKVSVLSGMAALRMATLYGMGYSQWLFTKGSLKNTEGSSSSSVISWAPYFELDAEKLKKLFPKQEGVHVLLFDGAPNPLNIPERPAEAPERLGAIVIDTTNNTSREKALYVARFKEHLSRQALLLMVDSASKHPTGGDLVHGVMRICGDRRSVSGFYKDILLGHLKINSYMGAKLTVLSEAESEARRKLIASRLVMRNADLWRGLGML